MIVGAECLGSRAGVRTWSPVPVRVFVALILGCLVSLSPSVAGATVPEVAYAHELPSGIDVQSGSSDAGARDEAALPDPGAAAAEAVAPPQRRSDERSSSARPPPPASDRFIYDAIANSAHPVDDLGRVRRASSGLGRDSAAPSSSRGLSNLGGVIEETGTNAAGGRIFTSTGSINQNDFAGIVNAGVTRGDDVHIFTGAHGFADGTIRADAGLRAADVARFGDIPGVHIHDFASMTPARIRQILSGPGTIIGGFCDSGACLAPYRGG